MLLSEERSSLDKHHQNEKLDGKIKQWGEESQVMFYLDRENWREEKKIRNLISLNSLIWTGRHFLLYHTQMDSRQIAPNKPIII